MNSSRINFFERDTEYGYAVMELDGKPSICTFKKNGMTFEEFKKKVEDNEQS